MKTTIVAVDGADGLTPDMLRRRIDRDRIPYGGALEKTATWWSVMLDVPVLRHPDVPLDNVYLLNTRYLWQDPMHME